MTADNEKTTVPHEGDNCKKLTRQVTLQGAVCQADQHRMTFKLELELTNGYLIAGRMRPEHVDTILKAFNGYLDGVKAQIEGTGRINRRGQLMHLERIENIHILPSGKDQAL